MSWIPPCEMGDTVCPPYVQLLPLLDQESVCLSLSRTPTLAPISPLPSGVLRDPRSERLSFAKPPWTPLCPLNRICPPPACLLVLLPPGEKQQEGFPQTREEPASLSAPLRRWNLKQSPETATSSGAVKVLTSLLVSRKVPRQVAFGAECVFSAGEPLAKGLLLREVRVYITFWGPSPLASGLEVRGEARLPGHRFPP